LTFLWIAETKSW